MKREILFRGFNEKNNKWIYGYYFVNRGLHFVVTDEIQTNPLVDWTDFVVIPDTIGQYTGLKDKNGVKIFEGDIIESKGYKHLVTYNENLAGFCSVNVKYPEDLLGINQQWINECSKVVIGNVIDNPELMK